MKNLKIAIYLCLFPIALFAQDKDLFHTINVPVDYADTSKGFTTIAYEFGEEFSKTKPTVFIITDAQQFYVRKGSVTTLQTTLLDSTFNVVGIIGRNNNNDLKELVLDDTRNVDWAKAHTLFSWNQYVNDINEVRKKIVGESGHIYLYGQSGGGFLIHQFLSVYGQYVDKAFTGAAVNYFLDAEYGINHDKFWEEATKENPEFKTNFKKIISQNNINRNIVAMLFQRQHFFVTPDSLNIERKRLLNTLLLNDSITIKEYQEKYQITAIQQFYSTDDGIPIRVRLFEFIYPLLADFQIDNNQFHPDLENLYFSALPLIEVYKNGIIKPQAMSFYVLHHLKTEVFILSGRYDHTADYRTQIALAASYPQHYSFIADDNHTFNNLKKDGMYQKLILSFFKSKNNRELDTILKDEYRNYQWIE
jgi:predicted lactoylglutathione lyase